MSIGRLFRILLAWRNFILLCTACCLVGVIIVSLIIPPIWQAHARVVLNTIKPDPVTGELATAGGGAANSYVPTQMNLITDYVVTGKAVDTLGWLSDPDLIARYQSRSSSDTRDFRSWAADFMSKNIKVKPVKDSNILEITYSANSPAAAKVVVDAVLKAFLETSVDLKTQSANETARFYEGELNKLKTKLDQAVAAETAYERESGIAMENDKTDVESARLQSLAGSGAPLVLPPPLVDATKTSAMELASVEAQITSASKTLGPNNPQMQELMRRKSGLEALVAKDEAASHAAMAASAAGAGNVDRQLASQKARVIAQSDKIGRLQTLQQDVDLRRSDYEAAALKFATYRAQADQTASNTFTALPVETPDKPLFPNWPLEIVGALVLGLGIGCLGALLLELLGRRVRSVEDLQEALGLPVVGVIAEPRSSRSRRRAVRPGVARQADVRAARA